MSPWSDAELRAIVGERPAGGDWSWCDECLRWEYTGDNLTSGFRKHSQPDSCARARAWDWLATVFWNVWCRAARRRDLSQARYLVRSGQGESWGDRPPPPSHVLSAGLIVLAIGLASLVGCGAEGARPDVDAAPPMAGASVAGDGAAGAAGSRVVVVDLPRDAGTDASAPEDAAADASAPEDAAADASTPEDAAADASAPEDAATDASAPEDAATDASAPEDAAADASAPEDAATDASAPEDAAADASAPEDAGDAGPPVCAGVHAAICGACELLCFDGPTIQDAHCCAVRPDLTPTCRCSS